MQKTYFLVTNTIFIKCKYSLLKRYTMHYLTGSNILPGKIMNKKYIWGPQDNYLNCIYLLLRTRELLTNN